LFQAIPYSQGRAGSGRSTYHGAASRGRERLGGQVERDVRASRAPPEERQHAAEVTPVERRERLRVVRGRDEQLTVGSSVRSLHAYLLSKRRRL